MSLDIILLSLLAITAVFATPPISDIDEKGLKSDTDDKLTNSIDDDSLDDRLKRSYESGEYQWGSPNAGDPFNTAYPPPNNYFGRSEFPGGQTNPFQQSPFDRAQPNNNYGRNPMQEVMGKALESVIVQSVRQLLDMTPLGSGQGNFKRSVRNARSVENIEKIDDKNLEKQGKVNSIGKLGISNVGIRDTHNLEKRDTRSGEDYSLENSDNKILEQNIIKEAMRQRKMRRLAYQQSLKNGSQKVSQQNFEGNWPQNMNDAQKLQYLSNYEKQLMDLYHERQNKARLNKDGGDFPKIRDSKQISSRYPPPQDRIVGDYSMERQQGLINYDESMKNAVQQPRQFKKYLQSNRNNSRFFSGQQFAKQDQGFVKFDEEPQNFVSNNKMSHQAWDQNKQFVQQQVIRKDNSIKKWNDKTVMQQNMNQQLRPEGGVPMQETQGVWKPQIQQSLTPQNQQFFNGQPEFPQNNNMLPQFIPKTSNVIPGKQRYQRTSFNEICKDGFTSSGVPCSMDTPQKQMSSDGSFENSLNNQEVLLQPPTLIKRYVTYKNRFIPPPQAISIPVTEQEMLAGEGKYQNNFERTSPIVTRFSDDENFSSQERREMQRNQADEGMMNGWIGQ